MAPIKVIIDTDPGVDDAMAILMAFNLPDEVGVIGLTTLFGNCLTPQSTKNAHILRDLAASKVPVVAGATYSLRGQSKSRIADFVHGNNGLGDTSLPASAVGSEDAQGIATYPRSAAEFIVDQVNAHPGEVVILALASLTNVALALQLDNGIKDKWKELVVLGGAFQCSGNVNPAAEANIYGDPDAADMVFAQDSKGGIRVVGLDVTHKCVLTSSRLEALRGKGRYGTVIADITKFYVKYHTDYYAGMQGCFCNDPSALVAVLRPELFTFKPAKVRVVADGISRGQTIVDTMEKEWYGETDWTCRPVIQIALDVRAADVVDYVFDTLAR